MLAEVRKYNFADCKSTVANEIWNYQPKTGLIQLSFYVCLENKFFQLRIIFIFHISYNFFLYFISVLVSSSPSNKIKKISTMYVVIE